MAQELTDREAAELLVTADPEVDHPIITQCRLSSPGLPSFAEGSPYLFPENINEFCNALREDVALTCVERAKPVFRKQDPKEVYPLPESCTPFLDANSLGFYIKPRLPLVFVRTRKGELLLEARVALKYLRENSTCFAAELEAIASHAETIFRPEEYKTLRLQHPRLASDVIQPYSSFTDRHISMRVGFWIQTPAGVSTVIGPPVNQPVALKTITGAVETDWHHFELFLVFEAPEFEGPVLFIEPGTVVGQLHFVTRREQECAELRFSTEDPGAEPSYWAAWDKMGRHLVETGKGTVAERGGIASVQIGCPHCYVSVTAAAEQEIPDGHVVQRGFNPLYKILKHASQNARKGRP